MEIWADTADVEQIRALRRSGAAQGFTTNPTLMRRAGVTDYRAWAAQALEAADGAPLSLEVLADELEEMDTQARILASWGSNVLVKIPITNCDRTPTYPMVARLLASGVRVNHTAILSADQVQQSLALIPRAAEWHISLFAGRIADTGLSPRPAARACRDVLSHHPGARIVWASTREIYNVVEAEQAGCDVITMQPEMIGKMRALRGHNLFEYSRETVMQFRRDVLESGIRL